VTEAEWLACDDTERMLTFLCEKTTDRKRRLFAVACCLRVRNVMTDKAYLAVTAAELFADGLLSDRAMHAAWAAVGHPKSEVRRYAATSARAVSCSPGYDGTAHAVASVLNAVVAHARPADADRARRIERAAQAELAREVFGNPFRAAVLDPSWLTSTVLALARGIYDDRAFDRLPILADALEEAGCDDAEVLLHCRGPGPHVRGCWVIDGLLGNG
jgi:hypothetical protein